MQLSEDEWKQKLTKEQYQVLREKGTEPPFSGTLLNEKGSGDFVCAACGAPVFKSDTKYDSTTPGLIGWPSFSDVADGDAVELVDDNSFGMQRTEVICKNCGSHLGHLFEDESSSNGKHYCINSCSLDFKAKK
ncbi:peptide-methionine (R)-S-oxide reductase [Candidatus Saccharibacteria bacterium CG_4_10_14_0_2_um_filter_52_9]|nr:MAG: peptide-methionine (R)-S-oxide reductase [Candidatus Saccharibacteria bacterium CG_4_10_14_0_2_um_filter_52_9]